MAAPARNHIEQTPGVCGGKPRIAGRRIRVQDIAILHEHLGLTADEILADYPDLSLADIYAALAYYHDHRDEIERDIRESEAFVAELRARTPSKLLQRLAELEGNPDSFSSG